VPPGKSQKGVLVNAEIASPRCAAWGMFFSPSRIETILSLKDFYVLGFCLHGAEEET